MDFHNTLSGGLVEASIFKLDLVGKHVIDLGFGTGSLSLMALRAGASTVLGIELGDYPIPSDHRIQIVKSDLRSDILLPEPNETVCVVMAPPYCLLDRCLDLVSPYANVWTLSPDRRSGFREVGCVMGDVFDPPSKGKHYILVRGPFAERL